MSVTLESAAPGHVRTQRIVLSAVSVTLLLATVDLLFACAFWNVLYRVPPVRIMQNIAAGLIGQRAFLGGSSMAFGMLLHYAIMGAMVSVYYLLGRRATVLVGRPWLYGSLYGLALFVVMNLVVLPLSAAPRAPLLPGWIASSIVMHVIIGLAIALSGRRVASGMKMGG